MDFVLDRTAETHHQMSGGKLLHRCFQQCFSTDSQFGRTHVSSSLRLELNRYILRCIDVNNLISCVKASTSRKAGSLVLERRYDG